MLVKAIATLLWLSLNQKKAFRQWLVTETKRFALSYLQSYPSLASRTEKTGTRDARECPLDPLCQEGLELSQGVRLL